jgi:hypothetical protein
MRTREAIINLRMKPDEKAAWQLRAEAANLTVADFIRQKVDGENDASSVGRMPKKHRIGRKADPLLIAGIGRAGSNLNQIARWANTYKSAAEASEIMLALIAIEQLLIAHVSPQKAKAEDKNAY